MIRDTGNQKRNVFVRSLLYVSKRCKKNTRREWQTRAKHDREKMCSNHGASRREASQYGAHNGPADSRFQELTSYQIKDHKTPPNRRWGNIVAGLAPGRLNLDYRETLLFHCWLMVSNYPPPPTPSITRSSITFIALRSGQKGFLPSKVAMPALIFLANPHCC